MSAVRSALRIGTGGTCEAEQLGPGRHCGPVVDAQRDLDGRIEELKGQRRHSDAAIVPRVRADDCKPPADERGSE